MLNVCPQCRTEHGADQETCPHDGARLQASAPAADPLIGRTLADRYRVIRSLGEGGMGRVYLAEHVRMGRLSAVKVMSPALAPSPEAIGRFHREAANASKINQPNVAAIYDFGETPDGTLYLAMEYVEGQTLAALLRQDGPFVPARAAELASQIADGLHAAHHLGIVHRDLKPDNILVSRHQDGREWVKIVDFGIAKATHAREQTVTSLGVAVGTPEYMSPEQIAGEPLDARTDLYSLGLLLFNMLTGVLPHPALTSKQSLVHRLTASPHTLGEVRSGVTWPPRLQKALDRALAPEPNDRYANVVDFAHDVRAAAGMPAFRGASIAPGSATREMTPLGLPAVRTGPSRPRPELPRRARPRRGLLFAALLVAGGAAAAAVHPPRALRALLRGGATPAPAPAAPATAFMTAPAPESVTGQVAQAGTPLPAGDSASVADSVGAPAADSLSPMSGDLRLRRAAMLAGMRANGESTSVAAVPPSSQSAEADAREVLVHVSRARELTRQTQLRGAGLELQTAYQEYRIFLTEHAAAPQTAMLVRELQGALDQALASCQAARDSVMALGGRGFRCRHPAQTGILQEDEDSSAVR